MHGRKNVLDRTCSTAASSCMRARRAAARFRMRRGERTRACVHVRAGIIFIGNASTRARESGCAQLEGFNRVRCAIACQNVHVHGASASASECACVVGAENTRAGSLTERAKMFTAELALGQRPRFCACTVDDDACAVEFASQHKQR
jgi:hypothetical protein